MTIIVVCDRSGKTDTYTFDTEDRFLEGLTNQQILDLGTHYLGTMTERCAVDYESFEGKTNQCRYRDGKGNSCALGYFISDMEYSPKLEGYSADQLEDKYLMPARLSPKMTIFSCLQDVHDRPSNWDNNRAPMKDKLKDLYEFFKCNPAMLDHPHMAWNNV